MSRGETFTYWKFDRAKERMVKAKSSKSGNWVRAGDVHQVVDRMRIELEADRASLIRANERIERSKGYVERAKHLFLAAMDGASRMHTVGAELNVIVGRMLEDLKR